MSRERWFVIPLALHTLLALVLCFVPLFDLLGYEMAFATGLLAAPTGYFIGSATAAQTRRSRRALPQAWGATIAVLAVPVVIMTLNALRVRNCNYWTGLTFYALIALATGLYTTTWGVFGRTLFASSTLSRRIFAALALGAPLIVSIWRLYWQPPIFMFDHVWGYFAGSLYDENIPLDKTLWLFRLGTLLRIAALVWVMRLLERSRSRAFAFGIIAAVVCLSYDGIVGPRVGFNVGRGDIERELPFTIERPNLVIHLPSAANADAIADDHQFRLDALLTTFEVTLPWKIHSYVYRDTEQKARLMGGRGTQIAKPWLHEIHVHNPVAPHDVVPHELAHAVAASFGSSLLGVSAHFGVFVNMGLVEGLAEAVTPERGAYDLHTWARALRSLGRAPNMRDILGPAGFWTQAPNRAYTVAGSFVRYLLSQYGPGPLKKAYPAADFEGAYGKSLGELVAEWEKFIDALPLSETERRLAEDQFKTPSIFAKPCAHEIAKLRDRAQHAGGERSVALYKEICKHLGDAPSARFDLAQAMRRAGDDIGFSTEATALLARDDLTTSQRVHLVEMQGQLAWQRGDFDTARARFSEAQEITPAIDSQRLEWVRLWALSRPHDERSFLRTYLDGEQSPVRDALAFERFMSADPKDPTLPYLFGRLLVRADAFADALRTLEKGGSHPFPSIEAERLRLIAEAYARLGQRDRAIHAYETYADATVTSGDRDRAYDAIARLRWQQTHAR